MSEKTQCQDYWEIRRGNIALAGSTIPYFGHPARILLDMYEHGYYLYKNGKRVKKCELAKV